MDINTINNTPFVFIAAKGRSGTTMLQSIFDANKHVVLPLESKLIIHLKTRYFKIKNWTHQLIDEFLVDLHEDKKFIHHWNVDEVKLAQQIKSIPLEKVSFQLLCKIIYLSYPSPFKKENILLIGDKNPMYSMFLEELREVFPEAKFIHLLRDYRDNVLSHYKTFKFEKIPALSKGLVVYNEMIEIQKAKNPHLFFTLKYEDLVANPEKYVVDLCQFLGIPFYSEMLEFNKVLKHKIETGIDEYTKREIDQIHPNITDSINTKQINKWKKELTPKQVEIIEYIAGDYAQKYGYLPSIKKSTKITVKIIAIVGSLRHDHKFLIIKNYYQLPMFIRNSLRWFSNFMFKTFSYTNYFNDADFRNKDKKKK